MNLKSIILASLVCWGVLSQKAICHQDLLISYGLTGYDSPKDERLKMCKFVRMSCCRPDDQLIMYSNWVTSREAKNLEDRFRYHREVYNDLVDVLAKVGKIAKRVQERQKDRRISNCKILAKRILHFRVEDIKDKVIQAVETMQDFFVQTYSGFYCSLCDAKTHRSINVEALKLELAPKFCRDITVNTLPVLLYFHVHFLKLINLASRFLTTCDHKGTFTERPVDENLNFVINITRKDLLEECKEHRNDGNWLDFCVKVCQEFNMVKFAKFFEPNIKEFAGYTVVVKAMIARLEAEEEREKRFLENVGKVQTSRLLAETNPRLLSSSQPRRLAEPEKKPPGPALKGLEITPANIAKLRNEFTNPLIFMSGVNAIVDLGSFKTRIEETGFDFLDNGRRSDISDNTLRIVKRLIKEKEKGGARHLTSQSILPALLALFLALSF